MEPDFKEGDIIVDPELEPVPGEFVVAKNGDNEATFKNTVLHLLIFQAASNMNWSP
jgi:SOS-response transcriptional repressor LexA